MASSILERLGVWRFPMSPGQGGGTALLTVASGDTVQVGTETNGVYTNIGTYTVSASVSYPSGVGYVVVRKVAGTNSSFVTVPDESARQPVSFDPSDNRLETPDGAAVGGDSATLTVTSVSGVDIYAEVVSKLAVLKLLGGGTLRIVGASPATLSAPVVVDFSNCVINLGADINYTGTQAPSATPSGVFLFNGTTTAYLQNVALVADRRVKIDCNGRNVVGYTYSTATQYAGVYFRMCEAPTLRNVWAYNSVHFGIQMSYCPNGLMENPWASDTIYDNGIQVLGNAEHIRAYSDTDSATWANVRIRNPRCWSNRNHGCGTWGGVGISIENPILESNGNNDGASPAGPAGGINLEYDQLADPTAVRNYRMTVTNPRIRGSWGFGIRANGKGLKVIGGSVEATKKPTHASYVDGSPAIWGSGIFVQNNGTADIDGTLIDGSDLYGIRAQGGVGQFPTVRFRGEIKGCVDRAIYGVGVALVDIDPASHIHDNGTVAGGADAVDITNAALNTNAGLVRVAGRFDENGGRLMLGAAIGEVDLTGVRGKNNCKNLAAANHGIYITSCQALKAADIMLTDANAKQARVLKVDSCVKAVLHRDSILGDQTSTTAPRAEVAATTLVGDLIVTAAPSTAPSYLGQKAINSTTGQVHVAKGQASSADWIALN